MSASFGRADPRSPRTPFVQKLLRVDIPTCRAAVEFDGLGVSAIVLHGWRLEGREAGGEAEFFFLPAIVEVFKVFSQDRLLSLPEFTVKIWSWLSLRGAGV